MLQIFCKEHLKTTHEAARPRFNLPKDASTVISVHPQLAK